MQLYRQMRIVLIVILATASGWQLVWAQANKRSDITGPTLLDVINDPDAEARGAAAAADYEAQQQQLTAEQAQARQEAAREEATRQQKIQDEIDELKRDANQKADAAKTAQATIDRIKNNFLAAKKQIVEDAWRDFAGVKKYVKSPDSGFVTFQGQILQTTSDGIRIQGNCGANLQTEFFVKNFPYKLADGDFTGTDKKYAAVEDGQLTYITISGDAHTIEQLDYGTPCTRPNEADEIEAAAQNFSSSEEEAINDAKLEASNKQVEADATAKSLADFLQKVEDDKRKIIEAKKAAADKVVKWNQAQADKGDTYGLLRMGERYRDGDGVEKDLSKAQEYLMKAANAGSSDATNALVKLKQDATAAKK
jgi:TPR repeat protein